ncbi:hypothetical protein ASPBRDRAFT_201951 [Aspergillus brasiliensis CBS 101740]|uniref:Zn(2)-C6 fungal-type domain-containing protein n=1 Tax=Aspergillus brasiliensis (strain CBS 101740 / IMI 381727 / IBT 21946) TaxID=767769 RepID=A0A1L9UZ71_ASPBC|nr:hypothetical protein ASPBRDRAFT_201951 [Aspergillus brasiliensis CBS 101740]
MLHPTRKRQKVALACEPCRARKVKCDGKRPVCNVCQQKSLSSECSYTQSAPVAQRTRKLQAPRPRLVPKHAADIPTKSAAQSTAQVSSNVRSILPQKSPNGQRHSASMSPARGEAVSYAVSHYADSMNGVMGDPQQTHEAFGSSSAGTFLHEVKAAIDARLKVPAPSTSKTGALRRGLYAGLLATDASDEDPDLYRLPPQEMSTSLMDAYWAQNWILYPFVNRAQIESAYSALWTVPRMRCRGTVMCLIHLCMALGCLYCEQIPPQQRSSMGDDIFARAEQLHLLTKKSPSLESVQCLSLMSVYLQSTAKVYQCWMMAGEAIRMAQSIGLHEARSTAEIGSISEREYMRRTWHGCVWLDRVISVTLGRPSMIPRALPNPAPLPSMIDDQFFEVQTEGSAMRPDGRPCNMSFAVKTLELYEIMNDVLVDLYMDASQTSQFQGRLSRTMEIDSKLQDWQSSLSGHLRWPLATRENSVIVRQALMMRIRYIHVRILLLRPLLGHRCLHGMVTMGPKAFDVSLTEVMLRECTTLCSELAYELIDLFNGNLDFETLTGPLPAWWYSVLYIFTAATVIVAKCIPHIDSNDEATLNERARSRQAWQTALRILRIYSKVSNAAERCVNALESIAAKIFCDRHPPMPDNLGEELREDEQPSDLHLSGWYPEETFLTDFPFDLYDMTWLNTMSGNS